METINPTTLEAYCIGAGIRSKVMEDYNYAAPKWALENKARHYRVQLRHKGRQFSLWYYQGRGIDHAPRAWDILQNLLSDYDTADYSLDDYVTELGYEIKSLDDYRNLVKLQKLVKRHAKALERLIGDDEFLAALREAAQL